MKKPRGMTPGGTPQGEDPFVGESPHTQVTPGGHRPAQPARHHGGRLVQGPSRCSAKPEAAPESGHLASSGTEENDQNARPHASARQAEGPNSTAQSGLGSLPAYATSAACKPTPLPPMTRTHLNAASPAGLPGTKPRQSSALAPHYPASPAPETPSPAPSEGVKPRDLPRIGKPHEGLEPSTLKGPRPPPSWGSPQSTGSTPSAAPPRPARSPPPRAGC